MDERKREIERGSEGGHTDTGNDKKSGRHMHP